MKVPLLDLKVQYRQIRGEVEAEIRKILKSQHFIMGPEVEGLEKEIAAFCGVPFAAGVASGTDALLLSLMALGVKPGDRVGTVPFTFFATGGSISRLGARPVFIDIDPETYNMDPQKLEDSLRRIRRKEERLKVLLPVHLFGQMAEMGDLMAIARRYDLPVVEDAAQALGARQKVSPPPAGAKKGKERAAGSVGDLGCFSFFPSKNLGAFGDGGMITTRDKELDRKIRMLRNHGGLNKYEHQEVGINSRLDALQAAVLRVKLRRLNGWTEGRRRNADRYRSLFRAAGLVPSWISLPRERKGFYHIYNQFVIRVKERDALREHLKEKGIGTEVYYPIPLHLQECYRSLGYRPGDLPESERACREVLALPIYPELTEAQQREVVRSIEEFQARAEKAAPGKGRGKNPSAKKTGRP